MPTYVGKPPKLSSAPGANRLPSGMQRMMDMLFPADALPMPMTTIGPGAIPLGADTAYKNKAISEILKDLGIYMGARQPKAIQQLAGPAKNILHKTAATPNVMGKAMAADLSPGMVEGMVNNMSTAQPSWTDDLINQLAGIFTPDY